MSKVDVIIVGAGSAGCVLAARLSEDSKRDVILIEAGPDYSIENLPDDIRDGRRPAFSHDWGYHNENGSLGREYELARAKLVGGCSATNATLALRGSPSDYDEWEELGNPGWSFKEVLPYFRKLEKDLDFQGAFHGDRGPIPIRRFPDNELTSIQAAFIKSAEIRGFASVADHNAPNSLGIGPAPMNTLAGVRQSTAQTYLSQARQRDNLIIVSGSSIDRVIISDHRATGVLFADGTSLEAALIILSAGAFGSPSILLRSGVGPAQELAQLGIDTVVDLPGVGRSLTDHSLTELRFETSESFPTDSAALQGMLTFKSSLWDRKGHDLQIFPVFGEENSFALYIGLMKPKSQGRLTLRSSNPEDAPWIDENLLAENIDLLRVVEGLEIARQIASTPPLADLIIREIIPELEVGHADMDLVEKIRLTTSTYYHPTGTCRMGPSDDYLSVVNSHARVYGIDGLAVIDASIMPTIPGTNTNLPVIMMAESCAEWYV